MTLYLKIIIIIIIIIIHGARPWEDKKIKKKKKSDHNVIFNYSERDDKDPKVSVLKKYTAIFKPPLMRSLLSQ